MSEPVVRLLAEARALREGRDRWHSRAPEILRALQAAGVGLPEIRDATGIAPSTASRLASRTSGNTSSATEAR